MWRRPRATDTSCTERFHLDTRKKNFYSEDNQSLEQLKIVPGDLLKSLPTWAVLWFIWNYAEVKWSCSLLRAFPLFCFQRFHNQEHTGRAEGCPKAGSPAFLALRKLQNSGVRNRNLKCLDEGLSWQGVSRIIRAANSSHLQTAFFLGLEDLADTLPKENAIWIENKEK